MSCEPSCSRSPAAVEHVSHRSLHGFSRVFTKEGVPFFLLASSISRTSLQTRGGWIDVPLFAKIYRRGYQAIFATITVEVVVDYHVLHYKPRDG